MPSTTIVINEVATQGPGGAADEYIEIKNISGQEIDLTGYRIVYRSAAGTADVSILAFAAGTKIAAGGYLLLANSGYTGTKDFSFSNGLSATGGGLAIRNGALDSGTIIDSLGYGNATNAFVEGAAAPAPTTAQALKRNATSTDSDNNSTDFVAGARDPQSSVNNPPAVPTLNITDVTASEGDAGTVTFTFTVSLSAASATAVTFSIATADNTATTAGGDYVGRSLDNQTILAGQTTYSFDVTVNSDDLVEGNETFFVNVTNIVGANAGDTQGMGTITNDDAFGALSINDVSLAEGNADSTAFTFTVTRSGGDDGTVSVTWTLNAPGGAGQADASDFAADQATTGTVEFLDGETSKTITVNVLGDTAFEANETFTVTLSDALGGATIADDSGTGTIQNDDAAPAGSLSIADVSLAEGDAGATTFTFTVSRTGGSAGAVTVDYAISAPGGAGVAGASDFVADSIFSGTVSFADGETSKTFSIDVAGDTVFEADETFTVTLSNATGGASIDDATATGTIQNDDPQPVAGSVSIADAAIAEGNSGTSLLVLTLTRSGGTAAFTVDFATANGGRAGFAAATAGSDYVAQSGTVSFAEGETTKTVSITINGDTAFELSEEFTVALSNATGGATIDDGSAIATITNDDSAPTSLRLLEEDFTGFTAAGFAPEPTAAQLDSDIWRAVGFSDIAAPAYGFTATTGDFARGVIVGSADPTSAGVYSPSADAAFVIQPTTAEIENGGFIEARIQNISGATATGFGVGFDWVYRNSGDRSSSLQFSYSTDGTNFVTVPASSFSTPTTKDATTASVFTSVAQIANLTGLSVADQGYLYLRWTHLSSSGANNRDEFGIDDVTVDATLAGPPVLGVSVSDVSVNEAAGIMTFTVTRTSAVANAFTVDYSTADGTAINGEDYVGTFGTLTFAENQVSQTVTVSIIDEAIAEFDETLLLQLSEPSPGATIVDGTGVGTIVNDDGPPIAVSIGDVTVTEGQSGTTTATFTVTRTGGTGAFDIAYSTADQTAQAGSDYVATSGILSFAAGENSKTISVTVNGDTVSEANETFRVLLSEPTNGALISDGIGIGTITTDDPVFIHQIQGSSYYSPILAAEGKTAFNVASTTTVIIQAVVTALDGNGSRQGFYLTEEASQWDSNPMTSEGIFVMTRNDSSVGTTLSVAAPNIQVGDIVTFSAQVMEYQSFSSMPKTVLVNMTGFSILSSDNALPVMILDASRPIPNSIMTRVTPDYTDSSDDAGDTFDATLYALSFWETVEGMLVTLPDVVVADGFIDLSGGQPFFQAYSRVHADADQINSRGGYTIAGDPPTSPPDTSDLEDDTIAGGRHLHDGDTNPDIIEIDFTGFAMPAPVGLTEMLSMGDGLGNVTGIVEFDFTDRKLVVTSWDQTQFVNTQPTVETTALGSDSRSLTVATFNVENLDPTDGAARFAALAGVIANNLNSPDIVIVEEMQDNNGGRENSDPTTKGAGDGTSPTGTDASLSWQMLVDALNAAVPGARYQWVDQAPVYNAEGGQNNGNIRVGFLYDTNRVQLGDLPADATIEERRQFTDRIGNGVKDGDRIQFTDEVIAGQINPADWSSTRLPLLGQFTFNGNTVFVVGNHFTAKGGSGSFWQLDQDVHEGDPTNAGWAKRNQQAQDVYAMIDHIQSNASGVGIVSGGDYNDFYFYRPLEVVTGYVLADGTARTGGSRFDNLTLSLSEAERYTYTFDGRSQALDHMVVNSMLSAVATYDVVHVNTGFNARGTGADTSQRLSDHDPAVASFDFRTLSEVLTGTANRDVFRLEHGGNDSAYGLGGSDIFFFGAAYTSGDTVDGGDEFDVIVVQGNYPALVLGANVTNVEGISLQSGTVARWGETAPTATTMSSPRPTRCLRPAPSSGSTASRWSPART
jgi:predicted extracellular nuclease